MVTAFWAGGFRSEWGREELKSVNFQWHLSSIFYFLTDVTEEISLHSGTVPNHNAKYPDLCPSHIPSATENADDCIDPQGFVMKAN